MRHKIAAQQATSAKDQDLCHSVRAGSLMATPADVLLIPATLFQLLSNHLAYLYPAHDAAVERMASSPQKRKSFLLDTPEQTPNKTDLHPDKPPLTLASERCRAL